MTPHIHILLRRPTLRNPLGPVFRALALRRQRNHLAKLDDHLLRDIGITRRQARDESGLPPWSAPDHWRS